MISKSKKILLASVLAGIILTLAIIRFQEPIFRKITPFLAKTGWIEVHQSSSWISLPFDLLVKNADIIFIGEVVQISATRWNQDSGEFWIEDSHDENQPGEAGLQFHTIVFKVSEFISVIPDYRDNTSVEVTIIGQSPLDGSTDYSLHPGEKVVFFARNGEIEWRGGEKHTTLLLVTSPSLSYFIQSGEDSYDGQMYHNLEDGEFTIEQVSLSLEELTQRIESIKARKE